jgi:hypothetical protein
VATNFMSIACKCFLVRRSRSVFDLTVSSTPWLTTRRRTCPNCKADVVRSFGRGGDSSYSSSSAQPLLAHANDESLEIDDVQEQAANTRNYDPMANEPITDLEQGSVDPDRTR